MAQTDTAITFCDVAIWLDNAAGVPVDISGSTNQVAMNFDKEISGFRTFKAKWMKRLECGKDAEFKLTGVYSRTADEAVDLFKDWWFDDTTPRKRTLKVYVPTKDVGSDVYSGEFRIKDLPITGQAGSADAVTVEVTLLPDGEVTLATNAT